MKNGINFQTVSDAFSENEKDKLFVTYVITKNFVAVFDMLDGGYYPALTSFEKIRNFCGHEHLLEAIKKCHGIKAATNLQTHINTAKYLVSVIGGKEALKIVRGKIELFSLETSPRKQLSFWSWVLRVFSKDVMVEQKEWEYLADKKEWELLAKSGQFEILIKNFEKDPKAISTLIDAHKKTDLLIELKKWEYLPYMKDGIRFLLTTNRVDLAVRGYLNLQLSNDNTELLFANNEAAELMYQKGMYDDLLEHGREDILKKYMSWTELASRGYVKLIEWTLWRKETFGDRSNISYKEYKNSDFGKFVLKYKNFMRLMNDGQSFLLLSNGEFKLFFMSLFVK